MTGRFDYTAPVAEGPLTEAGQMINDLLTAGGTMTPEDMRRALRRIGVMPPPPAAVPGRPVRLAGTRAVLVPHDDGRPGYACVPIGDER